MALEHAILVSLSEQAATGYDLARRFDASIGHFWKATHQQIYKVLARMEEVGWVVAVHTEREGRRDKKTYSPTEAGRAELARWSSEPSVREPIRSDFAVKLRGFVDPKVVRADTERRRAEHTALLARYEASEKKHYPDPSALTGSQLGAYLTLRGGILQEHRSIEWCDEILSRLGDEPPESQSTTP